MGRRKSALEFYLQDIQKGKIVACKEMKLLADRMLIEIRKGYKEWHFDINAAERPVTFIEKFCMTPSGHIGQPLLLEPYEKAIVEAIFGFVDDDGVRRFNEALVIIGRKNGKALSLDTPIPTPDGWKTMADIHPGDTVFGVDGKPSNVLVESQIFNKPMYAVTFEDGEVIKASADHIWSVQTKGVRKALRYHDTHDSKRNSPAYLKINDNLTIDLTTEQMANDVLRSRADGGGVEYKYRVPMQKPVEYRERELPIDPYTFGVWLGDGTSTKGEITCSEKDIEEMMYNVSACGHVCERLEYPSNAGKAPTVSIDHMSRSYMRRHISDNFKHILKEIGVDGNKHIPREYLESSVEQRLSLLQGLMDTDGSIDKRGECSFSQKDTRFLSEMIELLSSLGIKSNYRNKEILCNGRVCKAYEISFFASKNMPCFRIKRKYARLKDTLAPRMGFKSITNIERIPDEPSKCIAIDNSDHLYLAGDRFTATHNTTLSAAIELYMLLGDHEGAPQIYNLANSGDQSSLGFNACLKMRLQSSKIRKHTNKRADGLYCPANMGIITPLCSRPGNLDGLDVHCVIIDELSAMTTRDLYDLLKQGTSSREQPLVLAITTNGFVRDNIFDNQFDYAERWLKGEVEDDHFLAFVYKLDDKAEWDGTGPLGEKAWLKANPGLGTVKKWEKLRANVNKAKQDPEFRPTVLTKDFNMPENSAMAWLDFDDAVNVATYKFEDMGFRYGICGFDASDTVDLTSAQMLMMKPGDDHIYERSMYWIPQDVIDSYSNKGDRDSRDHVPYEAWIDRGLIRTVEGNKISKKVLIEWLIELKEKYDLYTYAVGFDPWHMDDSTLLELEQFVGKGRCITVRQGPATLSQPMKQLKADYGANRIIDNHNPINEWCRMNTMIKTDVNANIQPFKKNMDPRNRIDGFMAELDAYVTLMNKMDEYSAVC